MRVARPRWVPKNDEDRVAVDEVVSAYREAEAAQAKLKAKVEAADQRGVPRSHLAEASGISRATFYRRLAQDESE